MFSILCDPKLIGIVVTIAGCGTTFICLNGNKCDTSIGWLQVDSVPVMDCQKNGQRYQVFLTSSGRVRKNGKGLQFKIFDFNKQKAVDIQKSSNESYDGTGQKLQTSGRGDSWRIFNFGGKRDDISLVIPSNIQGGGVPNATCNSLRLEIKKNLGENKSSVNDNVADVRFSIDTDSCSEREGKKYCGIKFASTHNLAWNDDFQPKAVFYSST